MKQVLELSNEFNNILNEWLSAEELKTINRINKTNHVNVCATHDFCDSNMAMWEAFKNLNSVDMDLQSQSDMDLINEAWDLSKKNLFEVGRNNA